jgi:hypothetical protein
VSTVASRDGVLVPRKDEAWGTKRRRGRAEGKDIRGPANYEELGVPRSPSTTPRASVCRACVGRVPERKKTTLKPLLTAEVQPAPTERPVLTVVTIANGRRTIGSTSPSWSPKALT